MAQNVSASSTLPFSPTPSNRDTAFGTAPTASSLLPSQKTDTSPFARALLYAESNDKNQNIKPSKEKTSSPLQANVFFFDPGILFSLSVPSPPHLSPSAHLTLPTDILSSRPAADRILLANEHCVQSTEPSLRPLAILTSSPTAKISSQQLTSSAFPLSFEGWSNDDRLLTLKSPTTTPPYLYKNVPTTPTPGAELESLADTVTYSSTQDLSASPGASNASSSRWLFFSPTDHSLVLLNHPDGHIKITNLLLTHPYHHANQDTSGAGSSPQVSRDQRLSTSNDSGHIFNLTTHLTSPDTSMRSVNTDVSYFGRISSGAVTDLSYNFSPTNQTNHHAIHLRLEVPADDIGPVTIKITAIDNTINTQVWSQNESGSQFFHSQFDAFKSSVEKHGITLNAYVVSDNSRGSDYRHQQTHDSLTTEALRLHSNIRTARQDTVLNDVAVGLDVYALVNLIA